MKITIVFAALLALGACSPKQYESEPVTLDTAQGPVVCQLYTKSLVQWDRSISRPDAMSVETADALCAKEGQRQQG
ncbi:hypothetical protein J7376_04205 [Paracoccus sp. R12_1]|uniref:hypothetical protein n=1 Tax=unclassified Paracoccus (in: a-proteobacteria) TaxID=2688777 RepID=UPI000C08F3FE|nr:MULTISPECIES: hypothetical protein [unclassified Paracoccus (in: a-proteobacteria)]MBO9453939.1 hypothetical protein [Paracoccus sp. R12_2]MBO9485713.1 hypothetical protein [Paracoccus sp. R12_1]PHQ70585.1 MAG: hypothetical protein COB97_04500 [Paracoccus sp. (in: a-proteobacteria)]